MSLLRPITSVKPGEKIGNKARTLAYLSRKNIRIPASFVLAQDAWDQFKADPDKTSRRLLAEFGTTLDPARSYAVRSSTELEDSKDLSYAGQFETVLDVKGADPILRAVIKIWESADGVVNSGIYRGAGKTRRPTGAGILVQEMVQASWSGVVFSLNPVTGRNEIIIEAVQGSGTDLVQKGKTPHRWVYCNNVWENPAETASGDIPPLERLVSDTQRLRKICRQEVDIEWVYDGRYLYYLQCRSITARRFPVMYSNYISREVLPGLIKPLVWSVNVPLVNSAWIRLLEEVLGKLAIRPEELSRSFYYRAYFNMGTMGMLFRMLGLPANSLESLMGRKDPSGKSSFKPSLRTFRYVPRMSWFLIRNLRLGKRFERRFGSLVKQIQQLRGELQTEFSPARYKELFPEIMKTAREAAYFNIIIPLAMQVYNRLLKRKMDKRGLVFESLDFTGDFPRLDEFNPANRIKQLQGSWKKIPAETQNRISGYYDLQEGDEMLRSFRMELENFLNRFGHFSESGNDFSYPPWEEDPDFIFNMIRTPGESPKKKAPGMKVPAGGSLYRRAGRYRLYREMISSEYTRGYGLFRKLFLQSGSYLVQRGILAAKEDVFYLTLEEHDRLLEEPRPDESPVKEYASIVESRRMEMEKYRDVSLPPVIYGEAEPPLAGKEEMVFEGIPASPGLYEGKIVVVRGYNDFGKDLEGAILVIPFSDVGWTPILIKAGAIVSESGGMLSHASIVAREHSIPAVVSADNVCSLEDGTPARLDGYNGVLIINQ